MCRILVGADRYASTEPAANTPRSSIPRGWWRRALSLRWAASATVMTMLSPRRSRSLQGRDHPSARAMAVVRSRRVRDAGLGGLVQQPAALGAHRQHPAGRSRGTLLRHAGTACHGGVTQTKWLPTNPGRFTVLNKMYRECRPSRPFLLCSNSAGSSYFRRTPFASRLVEQQQSRSNQSGQSQLQRGLCRQLSCHCLLRRRFAGD